MPRTTRRKSIGGGSKTPAALPYETSRLTVVNHVGFSETVQCMIWFSIYSMLTILYFTKLANFGGIRKCLMASVPYGLLKNFLIAGGHPIDTHLAEYLILVVYHLLLVSITQNLYRDRDRALNLHLFVVSFMVWYNSGTYYWPSYFDFVYSGKAHPGYSYLPFTVVCIGVFSFVLGFAYILSNVETDFTTSGTLCAIMFLCWRFSSSTEPKFGINMIIGHVLLLPTLVETDPLPGEYEPRARVFLIRLLYLIVLVLPLVIELVYKIAQLYNV